MYFAVLEIIYNNVVPHWSAVYSLSIILALKSEVNSFCIRPRVYGSREIVLSAVLLL